MRGKEEFAKAEGIRIGITPAYAGKSHFALPNKVCIWDHPRLCGEKDRCGNCRNGKIGSPPPMRGKGKSLCIPFAVRRITPAYAGKSRQWYIDLAKKRDHPRLCGEKNFINRMKRRLSGSPPPMRGKDATIKFRVPILGITPAYAGKSTPFGNICQAF